MSDKPPRRRSGETPAVTVFRDKYESINENTLPMLDDLIANIDKTSERIRGVSSPPSSEREGPPSPPSRHARADSRREPELDARRDTAVPVDVVEVEKDPFPSRPVPPAPEIKR